MGITVTGTVYSVSHGGLPEEVREALRALFGHHVEVINFPDEVSLARLLVHRPLAVVFFALDTRAKELLEQVPDWPIIIPNYQYIDEEEGSPAVFLGTFSRLVDYDNEPQLARYPPRTVRIVHPSRTID